MRGLTQEMIQKVIFTFFKVDKWEMVRSNEKEYETESENPGQHNFFKDNIWKSAFQGFYISYTSHYFLLNATVCAGNEPFDIWEAARSSEK